MQNGNVCCAGLGWLYLFLENLS